MCKHHWPAVKVVQTTRVQSQRSSVFFQAFVHFLVYLKLGIFTSRIIYIANKYK